MAEGTNLVQFQEYTKEMAEAESRALNTGGHFKLKEGSNIVRFLPAKLGWPGPMAVASQHYVDVPGRDKAAVFVCPRVMAKRPCIVCNQAERLVASGNQADKKRGEDMLPNNQVFANVVDRREPDKGPQKFRFGKQVHAFLKKLRDNAVAGGDFTHPLTGFDLSIERTGTGFDTKYNVLAARNSSPLHPDPVVMNNWIASQADIHAMTKVPTDEEICQLLGLDPAAAAHFSVPSAPSLGGMRTAQDEALEAQFQEVSPSNKI